MRASFLRSVLLLSPALACGRPSPNDDTAHLAVEWNGSNAGRLEGSVVAEWCAYRRVLQVSLVQGDTGIALALYPRNALAAGVYPVVDPVKAESIPPSAGVAVRWLTQTTVQGFQGDSGRLSLERSATGLLSGQVHARARSVVDTHRIRLRGTFRNLTLVRDTLGCVPADTADENIDDDDPGDDDTDAGDTDID